MRTNLDRLRAAISGNGDFSPVATVATVADNDLLREFSGAPVAATGAATGLSHSSYYATCATGEKQHVAESAFFETPYSAASAVAAPVAILPATVADDRLADLPSLAIVPAALPDEWKSGMRRFAEMQPLPGFRSKAWRQAVIDGHQLLHDNGTAAFVMGWCPEDLFGLHQECPAVRTDAMGLAFLLRGRRILRLGEFRATIELPRGGETVYRRASAVSVVAWDFGIVG